jgi:hypothetical protein
MLFYTIDRIELKCVLVYSVVIIFTLEGNFIYSRVFDLWKIIVTCNTTLVVCVNYLRFRLS